MMISTLYTESFTLSNSLSKFVAEVICEPWFTGKSEMCQLWKNVNCKSRRLILIIKKKEELIDLVTDASLQAAFVKEENMFKNQYLFSNISK